MSYPPVWEGDRWLVEPGNGRRYVVAELVDTPAQPAATPPPAIAWAVLLAPLAIGLVAAVAAVLQPSTVLVLITAGALLSSVVAAVAASQLFDAALRRRPQPHATGGTSHASQCIVSHMGNGQLGPVCIEPNKPWSVGCGDK